MTAIAQPVPGFETIGWHFSSFNPHPDIDEPIENAHVQPSSSTNAAHAPPAVEDSAVLEDGLSPRRPTAEFGPQSSSGPSIFVGRKTELQTLLSFFGLEYDGQAIQLLSGPEGIGKTRLVRKFAETLSDRRKSMPIFHLDATSTTTLDYGLAVIARSTGVGGSSESALNWLCSVQEDFLLCVDSADDPAIDLVSYLPTSSKHARILLSTRMEEHEARRRFAVVLGGTEMQSFMMLGPLGEVDGEKLMRCKARMNENSKQVDATLELIHELQFHPLAIIQAAAVIRHQCWTAKDYLEEYTELRSQLSSTDDHAQNETARSERSEMPFGVEATWRLGYRCLSRSAADLLRLCSQFHHHGITAQMFKDAFHSISHFIKPDAPYSTVDAIACANVRGFLEGFADIDRRAAWNWDAFDSCIRELVSSALIRQTKPAIHHIGPMFTIRPSIHTSLRKTSSDALTTIEASFLLAAAIKPYCSSSTPSLHDEAQLHRLVLHAERVLESRRCSGPSRVNTHPLILSLLATCIQKCTHRVSDAEPLHRAVINAYKEVLGLGHPTTIQAINTYASTLANDAHGRAAEDLQYQVLKLRRAERGENDLGTMLALSELAKTLRKRGRFQEADRMSREAVDKLQGEVGKDHLHYIEALHVLADILRATGAHLEEGKLRQKIFEGRRASDGEDTEATIQARLDWARCIAALRGPVLAESMQRKALEQRRVIAGAESLDTTWTRATFVSTFMEQGRYKEGERMARDVYKHSKAVLGPGHPITLRALAIVSSTLRRRLAEAEGIDREVLEKRRAILGPDHHDTILAQQALADTLTGLGRFDEAMSIHLDVVYNTQRNFGRSHFETLRAQAKLADTFGKRGMTEEAATLNATVLIQRIQRLGFHHVDTVQSLTSAAVILYDFGIHSGAKKLAKRAVQCSVDLTGLVSSVTMEAELTLNVVSQPLPKGATYTRGADVTNLYSNVWPLLDAWGGVRPLVQRALSSAQTTETPPTSKPSRRLFAPLIRLVGRGKSQ